MTKDTALGQYAKELLQEFSANRSLEEKTIDCRVNGWAVKVRNTSKSRHIKLVRDTFTWEETITEEIPRSSIVLMQANLPESMKVEGALAGKNISSVIDLPAEISRHLEGAVISSIEHKKLMNTGIPMTVIRYE